jgi:hypothetical protein
MPMLSNRQRADESFARSHQHLMGAFAAIKAANDDAERKRREGLQDTLTQQSIQANQATLDKNQQEQSLTAQMTDHMDREVNPAIAGPALPGETGYSGPFSQKKYSDDFKYGVIAKLRTLRGKEATADQVRGEYEANAAANTDAVAAAATAPKLRQLNLEGQTANIAHTKAATGHENAEAEKARKEAEILGAGGKPLTADQTINNESTLLTKYLTQAKDYISVRDAFSRIQTSAKKPSAAGDLSLIFNYMKMLDPNSTVREGEFANAQNAGSAWNAVGASYNKIMSGERLTEAQRKDFLEQSKGLYDSQKKLHQQTQKTFRDMATRDKLNPDNVAPDLYLEEQTGPQQVGRFVVEAAP